jgi:ATP-binding cassette subfamily B (MDR/TAP) protein 1
MRTVVAFSGEERARSAYVRALSGMKRAAAFAGMTAGVGMGMVLFIMFCSYALALWYGGRLVLQDAQNYSGGTVLIVFFSVLIGAFGLGQAMPNLSSLVDARVAGGAIFEVIDRSPIIDAESEGRELDDMRGELALEDVSFSYPSRPDASIFSKFSLTVPAGATVALVGQSGSGKSTVIQLVERFYDPLAGSVRLDGVDIRELQLEWLRKQIGLVSQEPVLFATSIRENILYGKPDASEEEIVAAAKAANAHGFISKLPAGYATLCGERGTQMSGGQKQRIAIARAIVKDPKVLLLDEATSALDAESERVVQEALDRLMEGRTTIVVAHRLSTVRNADTIAVVEKGRVAERGSYADLMAKRGAFAALVKLQQRA